MTRAHQKFILEREPHKLEERFALSNRESVGAIHPVSVLDGSGVGTTLSGILSFQTILSLIFQNARVLSHCQGHSSPRCSRGS